MSWDNFVGREFWTLWKVSQREKLTFQREKKKDNTNSSACAHLSENGQSQVLVAKEEQGGNNTPSDTHHANSVTKSSSRL